MVKRKNAAKVAQQQAQVINLNIVPDTSGIPHFAGSRYTGKRGDDGRPLCTAPVEFGRCDAVFEYLTMGDSFLDSLGFDPRQRVEDATGDEEREALGAAWYAAPVRRWSEDWSGCKAGYPIPRLHDEIVDGTPEPDYEMLRELSDKPWTYWDPRELGEAFGRACVAAATDRNGRLNFKEVWQRVKALRADPEYIARAAERAGIPCPVRRPLPLKDKQVLPTVWVARNAGTAKRILPTDGQASAACRIAKAIVWQATNAPKANAPQPQPTAPATVVRRRRAE
jgi:hypothetical protein